MRIRTHNHAIERILASQKRADGQIAEGIYIEAHSVADTGDLVYLFIGSTTAGPMLQYTARGDGLYDGIRTRSYPDGGWTNCYSRGDFGKKYAAGGIWSAHCKHLHKVIADGDVKHDKTYGIAVIGDGASLMLPDDSGIKPDIEVIDIDCSMSWAIFAPTAREALRMRLHPDHFARSTLPPESKLHLAKNDTQDGRERLAEVIEIYGL